MAQKHHGDLVVNLGSSPAYIHVGFTNCPNPAPWQILGLCPGFSATLVNEDKSPVLSGALPPGWSGWIKVAADASVPSNTTCCFQVKIVCNGSPGIIDMCATSCTWSVSTVPPVPDKVAFGIFRTAPSPASTGTVIDFVVPTSGPVRVEAFDLSGRQVRLVMTGPVEAGVHSVRWDMRGEGGSPIAPGTYFIKLSAAGQTSTRKIVLVR
ncbi:MAG TPA: T9SS type A sorting domain-containing protein, partial [Candidatus Eisenbacteria bacterium]